MLGGLGAAIRKDLRLLTRDRAGLVFLAIAPVVVITVAGFSLASFYGVDARGTAPYVLPLADDGREPGSGGHLRDPAPHLAAAEHADAGDLGHWSDLQIVE